VPGLWYRRQMTNAVPVVAAPALLRAACGDGTVTVGPGTRTLRAELPDRAALRGLVQRIMGLGPGVVDLHLVTAGSW